MRRNLRKKSFGSYAGESTIRTRNSLRNRHHYTRPTALGLPALGGIFKLGFFNPGNSRQRYIGIWYNEDPDETIVWVANRDTPISDSNGVLTIDGDGKLKIVHGHGEDTLIVLNSNQATTNATATLEDTGNFVMREVNSKRVLWQSFDCPTNTLLPGMKLGVNFKTGHRWSLVSWLSSDVPASGTFTLGGDPNGATQLFMWQRENLYWTSGAWRNGTFEFFDYFSLFELNRKYHIEYISDEDETYLSYSVEDGSDSMWVIENFDWCDGYSLDGGCLARKLPECRKSSKYTFVEKFGSMIGQLEIEGNSSLGLGDCKAECMSNCSCVAYYSHYANGTGCEFWSNQLIFHDFRNGNQIYVLDSDEGKSTLSINVALVILLLDSLYRLRKKLRLEGEMEAGEVKLFSEFETNVTTFDNLTDANELNKDEKETDTITQGQQLLDYQHLVSAGGIFKLGFFSPRNSKHRYLGIWYKEDRDETVVWVANRNIPIMDTSGVLTIDGNGNLKIVRGEETLIVLNSNKATTNSTATLEDNGNFIMREVNSKQVLWQSFDYPTNTLLPGMKLGVNFKTGHRWSLVSWLSSEVPASGAFTLGGDPNGTSQLFMWQRGDLYWTSGVWSNGSFEFLRMYRYLLEAHERFQMQYISEEDEKYITYSVKDGSNSMWVMELSGKIMDHQQQIGTSAVCDGYSSDGGCLGPKLPECRSQYTFRKEIGGMNGQPEIWGNLSLGLSDCYAECMGNCSCVAYGSRYRNGTGCMFWSRGSSFEGFTAGNEVYVDKVALVILLLDSLYRSRRKLRIEVEKDANELVMLFSELETNATTFDNLTGANEVNKDGKGHDLKVFSFALKSDVFSFGVLLLEIVSGRKNNSFYDPHHPLTIIGYVFKLREELKNEREGEIVWRIGAFVHMGVHRNGSMRRMSMRKGSNERVADKDMGSVELVEEEET
ncbi:hypothetical protein HHK36_021591 [Tetracentron sinense]|uniref:non-specific serine/threonine protein kinase n=1 Tax=Tetracentron sinense TaxID=13715 RepID=A0A835D777_TETSI|nr:hypothetical protein HHK36_021591 [Tetracentron sinense]